jgi:hypothetical protein
MKRTSIVTLAALLFALRFACCAKQPAAPVAGSAKADDILALLPLESQGVIVIDIHRLMQTAAASKSIQEGENAEKYQKFVQETGIDPQKDVYFAVAAMTGSIGQTTQDGAVIVNMKYDKEKLLSRIKQERGDLTETDYNGLTIYQATPEEGQKPVAGAFLDSSNILLGSELAVKKVVDVYQKKATNIWKSEGLPPLLKGMDTASMIWGAFLIPAKVTEQAASQNPMLASFSDVRSILIAFDSKNDAFTAEIKAMCPDVDKNKQMAEALMGFKSLGGAAVSAKEPLLGEVLNKIEITSAADHVKIAAAIPEALVQSLSQKVKVTKDEENN